MESFGDSQQESGFLNTATESEPSEEHRSIPCQCLSDMIPDFKRVLKNIADDITELSKLTFMCDMSHTGIKGEKLTALDILSKQYQKGKFAHDNIEPLERLLTDIDRCDLASKHIEQYKKTYGEHTVSRRKCYEVEVRNYFSTALKTRGGETTHPLKNRKCSHAGCSLLCKSMTSCLI